MVVKRFPRSLHAGIVLATVAWIPAAVLVLRDRVPAVLVERADPAPHPAQEAPADPPSFSPALSRPTESAPPAPEAAPEAVAAPDSTSDAETPSILLRVLVRDGSTGDIVHGIEGVKVLQRTDLPPLPREGDRHVLRIDSTARGKRDTLRFRAVGDLPAPFVKEERGPWSVFAHVAKFAESIELDLLVWPEADVRLFVEEEDGSAARGAELAEARVGVHVADARAESTDVRGETRIRGVPVLRGEYLVATVELDGRKAESDRVALQGPGARSMLRAVLPDEVTESSMGIGICCGGAFGGRKRSHLVLGETGSCEARVLRRDGKPASGALVLLGGRRMEADEEGRAVFDTVIPGLHVASVREPGFLVDERTVTVVAGERVHVELHQADGVPLAVTVRDDAGNPVTGASLNVETPDRAPCCFMRGDTQILEIYTDMAGRAVLPGLPPGAVTVTARFGSRAASESAESGGAVEIRLPPSK